MTVAGKKIPLSKDKAEAEKKFHELMLQKAEAPESPKALVAEIIEAFLGWAETHVGAETLKQYRFFGQKLAGHSGLVPARDFKPLHVSRLVQQHGWTGQRECYARRHSFRFFSWAHFNGRALGG